MAGWQRVAFAYFSPFPFFISLSLLPSFSLSLSLSSALIFEFENLYLLNVQVTNVIIFKIKYIQV